MGSQALTATDIQLAVKQLRSQNASSADRVGIAFQYYGVDIIESLEALTVSFVVNVCW